MYNIEKLNKQLPIKLGEFTLKLITRDDVPFYIENFKQKYMNEYMDERFDNLNDYTSINMRLRHLALSYKYNSKISGEARLILTDTLGSLIGGITIYERTENMVELGYWIVPSYQGKGIATKLILQVISIIKNLDNIKYIKLAIREDNIKSINLALRTGFELETIVRGKLKYNNIYIMEI